MQPLTRVPADFGGSYTPDGVDPIRAAAILHQVVRFSEGLFQAPVIIESDIDPEFGGNSFVVQVRVAGGTKGLLRLSDHWHRELHLAAEELTVLFCLAILPADERPPPLNPGY